MLGGMFWIIVLPDSPTTPQALASQQTQPDVCSFTSFLDISSGKPTSYPLYPLECAII